MKKLTNNKKAQALLEIAILGAVVLFCFGVFIRYGLTMNYQQRAQMEAHNRALIKAYQGSGLDSYLNASYTVVKDKPIPDPANLFALGQRQPVTGRANVTMTVNLFRSTEGLYSEAPRVFYVINGTRYVFTTAESKEYETTESNGDAVHDSGEIWIKVKKAADEIGGNPGTPFKWVELKNEWSGKKQGKLVKIPKSKPTRYTWTGYDLDNDSEEDGITKADVDGDEEEEGIISIEATGSKIDDGNALEDCTISKLLVWDYQEGDIDLTIDDPELAQGLSSDLEKEITNQSKLIKTEDKDYIGNQRLPGYLEKIIRKIKVNPNKYNSGDTVLMDTDGNGLKETALLVYGGFTKSNQKYVYVECADSFKTDPETKKQIKNWTTPK